MSSILMELDLTVASLWGSAYGSTARSWIAIFRTFSGHTQVNATDLRSLRFPSVEALRRLGNEQPVTLPEQRKIDTLVRKAITEVGAAA